MDKPRVGTVGAGWVGSGSDSPRRANSRSIFLKHGFCFFGTANGFEPAWGFGHGLAEIPHDKRADSPDDKHNAPANPGDEQRADQGADGQTGDDDSVKNAAPSAARLRGKKLGHGRVAGDKFRTEADAHHATEKDERLHRRSEGRSQRGKAEDDEVGLVGEAAAIAVTEEAGKKRAEHHANEGDGDKLRVLRERGKAGFERGPEDGGGDIDVVAVEEHADADECEDSTMKR